MVYVFLVVVGLIWLFSSIVSSAQDSAVKSKRQKEQLAKVKEKWGSRVVDKTQSLEARNDDIIQKHIYKLNGGYHRSYYIENSVRDCIQDIAEAEGNLGMTPNYAYLSSWMTSASPEYKELADSLVKRFRQIHRAIEEKENQRAELEKEETIQGLKRKHVGLINQFHEIAQRKVSLRDDYGDENWGVLDKEIATLIQKIATKEGHTEADFKQWKKYDFYIPDEYKELGTYLKESFQEHYATEKAKPRVAVDYTKMTGVDFEGSLMQLLSDCGFTNVRGTSATGDQGADLLAERNGKKIVIQAKRYSGTVGNKAVQEVVSALSFYSGDEGWVITNSSFTKSAKELAQKTGIRLIDGHDLLRFKENFS